MPGPVPFKENAINQNKPEQFAASQEGAVPEAALCSDPSPGAGILPPQ